MWLSFESPVGMAIAAGIAAVVVWAGWRAALPAGARWTGVTGLVLLVVATGGLTIFTPERPRIAVLVDASPATRTAFWREAAALESELSAIRRAGEVTLFAFADGLTGSTRGTDAEPNAPGAPHPITASEAARERPAAVQHASIPAGFDAVVVLGDGRARLDGPAIETWFLVDPRLDAPEDAAMRELAIDGADVLAVGDPPLLIDCGAAEGASPATAEATAMTRLSPRTDRPTLAAVIADDPWPENDALRLPPVTLTDGRRLWISDRAPPAGFEVPQAVPDDPAALADVAVVVLDDMPADRVTPAARQALASYVRDMGGTLVILGGSASFGAGGWEGTKLDALSPLASIPPVARQRWILLVDASGSMAMLVEGRTRFEMASAGLGRALAIMPEGTPVTIGGFAADVKWWAVEVPAIEARRMRLPPEGERPGGPTNLEPVLRRLAEESRPAAGGAGGDAGVDTPAGDAEVHVLVVTDGEVPFEDAAGLARSLREGGIVLHVLVITDEPAPALAGVVEATGGLLAEQSDAWRWGEAVASMVRAVADEPLVAGEASGRFVNDSAHAGEFELQEWNRVWLREDARVIVDVEQWATEARADGGGVPRAAVWNVGLGAVVAVGFETAAGAAAALAEVWAAPPLDPAVRVEWQDRRELVVRITTDRPASSVTVQRAGRVFEARRVAPGTWLAEVPAPRTEAVATVLVDGRVVERRATASRYPAIFHDMGNDYAAMRRRVAEAGGGIVATAGDIRLSRPHRPRPLAVLLHLLTAAAILTALILWRRG